MGNRPWIRGEKLVLSFDMGGGEMKGLRSNTNDRRWRRVEVSFRYESWAPNRDHTHIYIYIQDVSYVIVRWGFL